MLIINYANILEMPPKQVFATITLYYYCRSSNNTIILDITLQTPKALKAIQTLKTRKRKVDYYTL